MYAAIKQLFEPHRRVDKLTTADVSDPPARSLHWRPSGAFQVPMVGEAYGREVIAGVAQNKPGKTAMAFCTARLVPEDMNPHDQDAVAVYIANAKVGHLPRERAADLRAALARLGQPSLPPTTCDAAIVNGLVADGKAYDYAIELDLDLLGTLPQLSFPQYPEVVRRDPTPSLQARGVGLFEVTVWLPHAALHDMDQQQRVKSWTTEHWDTVNYYLRNTRGIGLGHKVVSVPKKIHAKLFGDREPQVSVLAIEGRNLTLLFKRSPAPSREVP